MDRLSAEKMPHVHSFADDALKFTTCIANGPSTPASFPAIHASRHFASIRGIGLPEKGDVVTTAECFKAAGYETAGFTDNHFASGSYNFDRGFDTMVDAGDRSEPGRLKQFVQSNLDKRGLTFRLIERVYTTVDSAISRTTGAESEYTRAGELNERALEWVDERTGDWFLWLHYMDAHHPYEPPEPYLSQHLAEPIDLATCRRLARKGTHYPDEVTDAEWDTLERLYDAECAYVDDQFQNLLKELEEREVLDDTVVCLTADHGELVGEHNHAGHPPEFWEGIVRVPLVIANAGIDGVVDKQVCLLDLPPSFTDVASIDGSDAWQGKSVLSVARGEDTGHRHVFGDVGRNIDYSRCYARRDDGWKLLRHGDDGEFLFDVGRTPAERPEDNRLESDPERYHELASELDDHQERMREMRQGAEGIDADDEMVEEHLRDLGYL